MNCKVCNSKKLSVVDTFKPYKDKDWLFQVYDCLDCHTRFAIRDNTINYHNELHSTENSPYLFHYKSAEKIKNLLSNDLEKCKVFLSNKSPVLKEVFDYIQNKDSNIAILEIGCSTGYVIAYLQKIGYQNSLGIDISSSVINYAQSAFGDYYALKEEQGKKYDVIYHTGVIGCVDKPIEFLNYYLSLLNSGGVMFFNAPNVNSIKETNEFWVSTPPPDLIYLFNENVFAKVLDSKYTISFNKTLSPLVILRKYINKFKKKKNNIYPRKFISSKIGNSNSANKLLKGMMKLSIMLLVKINILKHYSDDYGLIYRIDKVK